MKNENPISIEQALKDGNSVVNQEIKAMLIQREVYCNVGQLVECVLRNGENDNQVPFTFDDIENYYTPSPDQYKYIIDLNERGEFSAHVDDYEGTEVWKVDTAGMEQLIEDGFLQHNEDIEGLADYLCKHNIINSETLIAEDDDFETEPQEIYEWWAVSSYLMKKLKAYGEAVIDSYPHIWGRACTGQAILLDYVITKIAADMEILEGQKNAWK